MINRQIDIGDTHPAPVEGPAEHLSILMVVCIALTLFFVSAAYSYRTYGEGRKTVEQDRRAAEVLRFFENYEPLLERSTVSGTPQHALFSAAALAGRNATGPPADGPPGVRYRVQVKDLETGSAWWFGEERGGGAVAAAKEIPVRVAADGTAHLAILRAEVW